MDEHTFLDDNGSLASTDKEMGDLLNAFLHLY